MTIDLMIIIGANIAVIGGCILTWRICAFMRRQIDKDIATHRTFNIPEDCDDQPKAL